MSITGPGHADQPVRLMALPGIGAETDRAVADSALVMRPGGLGGVAEPGKSRRWARRFSPSHPDRAAAPARCWPAACSPATASASPISSEAFSSRLYTSALINSLILGAWTGLFSILVGVPLAWAVSRTNVPGKALITVTATLSYLSPPFLTAIAFVNLFSPNAGLINIFFRDVAGMPWLTFNIFTMSGLVLVTVLHTFPFVYLLTSTALRSVDASFEEAAQILGAEQMAHRACHHRAAGRAGHPVGHADRLRQRDRAVRLAGDHRPARPHRHAADAHLLAVRLPAGIRPCLRAVADLRRDHHRRALSAARVPRPALLRDAGRQGRAPAARRSRRRRAGSLFAFCVAGVHRRDRRALSDADRRVVQQVVGHQFLARR